ncbi:MAG: helix-turn-helix transcriptional regulator [Blastocatellia bacterium]|nr:helix-turn-helix transcriptional regulator [Blastocatellia bacterium]
MDDKDLYSGLIRLHVLHHASLEPIFGLGIIEELGRHGYRLSSGTLYPLLHGLEKKGYLRSAEEGEGRQARRVYRATSKGRRALAAAKVNVHELFSELLEAEEAVDGSSASQNKTVDDLELMDGLFSHLKAVTLPQLRRGARKVRDPRSQAFLETAVAVVEGLVKAFIELEQQRKS